MKIIFEIEKNYSATEKILIDKFFQFVIIGDKVSGKKRTVNIFTALSYRTETGNAVPLNVIQNFEDFSNDIGEKTILHQDKSSYYQQEDILKQFWGKTTTKLSNPEFSNQFGSYIKSNSGEAIDELYDKLNGNLPLLVEESEKDIEKFFIIPAKIQHNKSKTIILKPPKFSKKIPKELKKLSSFGFWFHSEFSGEFKEDISLSFLHEINSSIEIACNDFKIYYQTSKEHDIKSFKYSLNDKNVEIIKVYSQQNTSYFDDWKKLKIYESSLLRLHNSNSVNEELKLNKKKRIIGEIELIDYKANRKKELQTIIITMLLSLLLSLGLDATRLTTDTFNKLFEITIFATEIPASLVWFILCSSMLPKFFSITPNTSGLRRIIYFILSVPISIIILSSIHLHNNEVFFKKVESPTEYIALIDMAFSLFLIFGFMLKKYSEKLRIKLMHSDAKYDKLKETLNKLRSCVNLIWGE
jgi:hypothetical protein